MNSAGAAADASLRSLIRARPLRVEALEDVFGYGFWDHLDDTLSDYCLSRRKDAATVLERFSILDEKAFERDWMALPAYYLIDHLTVEHREYRERDLPAIQKLLKECSLEFGLGAGSLGELRQSFHDFTLDFLNHMEEEEDFLFPKIMLTEASLRHPGMYPEIFKGSIRMYSDSLLHSVESAFAGLMASFVEKAGSLRDGKGSQSAFTILLAALRAYDAKIRAHTYLESAILFPKARIMENELVRRAKEAESGMRFP